MQRQIRPATIVVSTPAGVALVGYTADAIATIRDLLLDGIAIETVDGQPMPPVPDIPDRCCDLCMGSGYEAYAMDETTIIEICHCCDSAVEESVRARPDDVKEFGERDTETIPWGV